MSDLAPASRQAFHELLDLLRQVGDEHFSPERGVIEEVTAAEGYRSLTHLLAGGLELHLESDPQRPMFTRTVSPQRKLLGDNPDALYYWTRIDGTRSYRIRGHIDGATYTSFTVHGADPEGGSMARVIGAVNDDELAIGPDGSYEIVLAPQQQPGNWVRLEPDAAMVLTRHYFERPVCVTADPEASVRLRIDPIDDPGAPAPLDDATLAARLRAVHAFVRSSTLGMPAPGQGPAYPFVSRVPNVLPRPTSFGGSGAATWGAVDLYYAMAPYLLQPDQALVMEGRIPASRFANVVLWNMHMQTLEYRFHRSSLNRTQMQRGPDGAFRIVVAHRDPGVPNWIDTEGHMLGLIFWRIVLPESEPDEIRCAVVQLEDL
ncbi:MAG: DUF1214 domain-containing protein [Candidatus Binatia bacterium]